MAQDEQRPREEDVRFERRPMAGEDKVVLGLLAAVVGGLFIGLLIALKWGLSLFGVVAEDISEGIGLRGAFFTGLGLSFFFIVIFALVAGDGAIGELGVMLVGFFVMLAFFTLSIAIVL